MGLRDTNFPKGRAVGPRAPRARMADVAWALIGNDPQTRESNPRAVIAWTLPLSKNLQLAWATETSISEAGTEIRLMRLHARSPDCG